MNGRIGPHAYTIEGDVLHLRFAGDMTREHMVEMLRIVEVIQAREGQVFTLTDARGLGHMAPEARRYAFEWVREHRLDGSALYGSGLVPRMMVTLMMRAVNLVRAQPLALVFVATEQEARAWIRARSQPSSSRPGISR